MTKKHLKLSQILKKLLFERDMRPADLAREVDMPIPTIHRIVTGKSTRPYPGSLQAIAKFLGVTVDQLTGDEPMQHDVGNLSISKDAKIVPVIEWGQVADFCAGKKIKPSSELVVMNIGEDAFALSMPDYSMEPLFQKNSTLIFDPKVEPTDRSYVLVKLKNPQMYIFRQLLLDGNHQFIKPLNHDISSSSIKLLDSEDEIIARLIEVRNTL